MKVPLITALLCLALAGCSVKLHGHQSAGAGAAAVSTAGAAHGSASFSGGRVSISTPSSASPGAPGGHITLGRSAAGVLLLGLVVADTVNLIGSWLSGDTGRPEAEALPASISHTCSCYGYRPPRDGAGDYAQGGRE